MASPAVNLILRSQRDPTLFKYKSGDSISALGGTFSRTSAATYTDVNGVVQTAVSGAIRDAHYINGVRTTLLEGQRTNLALHSGDISQAAWQIANCTKNSNVTTAPDGTATGDSILETTTNDPNHQVQQQLTVASGQAYTFSIYLKQLGRDWVRVSIYDVAYNNAFFNLTTGAKGATSAGVTSSITPIGSGWYRCAVTFTVAATTGYFTINPATADNTATAYVGDVTKGVYVWGFHVEAGAFASSHIPTTSATVTRAADSNPYTLASHESWTRWEWYYATSGTLTEGVVTGTGSYSFTPSNDRAYRAIQIVKGIRDVAFFSRYK